MKSLASPLFSWFLYRQQQQNPSKGVLLFPFLVSLLLLGTESPNSEKVRFLSWFVALSRNNTFDINQESLAVVLHLQRCVLYKNGVGRFGSFIIQGCSFLLRRSMLQHDRPNFSILLWQVVSLHFRGVFGWKETRGLFQMLRILRLD